MRLPQQSKSKILGVIAFVAVLAGPASAVEPRAVEPRLRVDGEVVEATEPPVLVTVPGTADYLGGKRWVLYGYADCDLHIYAEKDAAGIVQRLYWIQSEAYIPSRPELTHANDYIKSRKIKLGGLDFHLDTWIRKLSNPAAPDSDLEQVEKLIAARNLRLPDTMSFVRLVHLPDKAKRKELMIIYGERLDDAKSTAPDGNIVARMRDVITITALPGNNSS